MTSWIDFWNADNPIYVNDRHKALHCRLLAKDLVSLVPDGQAIVLDYGCGEALAAETVASACRKLYLSDAAPNVRIKLEERLGKEASKNGHIGILSPQEVDALAPDSLNLIILHSIAQYIPKPEFAALITRLAAKLAHGGRIIVGDILPEGLSAFTDAKALLGFGLDGGFLIAAGAGLVRAALSDYRKIRAQLGLAHYDEAEMLALIEAAGLTARRLEHNPGHNQARMAFAGLKVAPLE